MKDTTEQKLKIVRAWFKKWGWAVVLGIGAVALFAFIGNRADNDNYRRLLENYRQREQEYEREKRELQRIENEKEQKQYEVLARYNEMLLAIEERSDERLKEIAQEREHELKEIISESRKDPKEMQRRLNEAFGIEVFEQPRDSE